MLQKMGIGRVLERGLFSKTSPNEVSQSALNQFNMSLGQYSFAYSKPISKLADDRLRKFEESGRFDGFQTSSC